VSGWRATISCLLAVLALVPAGCGGEDEPQREARETGAQPTTSADESRETATEGDAVAELAKRPGGEDGLRVSAERARIVADESDFGTVLFDANGQAVYVFENDRTNRSNCTSAECVKAWPPVLTRDEPSAGAGIDAQLLGTIRRADGMRQVTYKGRPLYFYEHEGPRQVKCHNVELHGGLWWVVTPRGDPAD
jgi:predicted lipoprotein with Yx(FWY)xxD motif